ncbi:MAG: PriCT-2 domain-containing protein [Pseudomonadota bacterium]
MKKLETCRYAIAMLRRGYQPMPLRSGTKRPARSWDPWLEKLSGETIQDYYTEYPDDELAIILGDQLIVFDTDTPESKAALYFIEEQFDLTPDIIVETAKGEHHWFRLPAGSVAKSSAHSSEQHPDRIDVKTGRAIAAVPPSSGKRFMQLRRSRADQLTEAPQTFIDTVARHNGQTPPSHAASTCPPDRVSREPIAAAPELVQIEKLLDEVDPDVGYDDWLRSGMACHSASGGHSDGLETFDRWSSEGSKYPGRAELEKKYASFDHYSGDRVGVGSVVRLAREQGVEESLIESAEEAGFLASIRDLDHVVCTNDEVSVVNDRSAKAANDSQPGAELRRYSLKGKSALLEFDLAAENPVLEGIAVSGQWTIVFAPPNMGKTLITISLLLDGIASQSFDPDCVFYVNADDNLTGLRGKLEIAEKAGIHMLAPGLENFRIETVVDLMQEMAQSGTAPGTVLIIDTIKKIVDPMDKSACRRFGNAARPFVMQGGTLICLAHVNKNRGRDGEIVYAGTSDLRDDADCAFTIDQIGEADGFRTVEFRNIKLRGGVAQRRAFRYSIADGQHYEALLKTVQLVEPGDIVTPEQQRVSLLNTAIEATIEAGDVTRGRILDRVRDRTESTRGEVERALDASTGTDPEKHRWSRRRGENNSWVYELLNPKSS